MFEKHCDYAELAAKQGPGNLGYPVCNTAGGRIGVYICVARWLGRKQATDAKSSWSAN